MGGCVSSPKEVALNEGEVAPVVETPTTPKNAEGQTVDAQVNTQLTQEEGDNKEEPLVELTEAKDEKVEEAKAEEAEVVVVTAETQEPEKEEVKAEQLKEAEEKSEEPLLTL